MANTDLLLPNKLNVSAAWCEGFLCFFCLLLFFPLHVFCICLCSFGFLCFSFCFYLGFCYLFLGWFFFSNIVCILLFGNQEFLSSFLGDFCFLSLLTLNSMTSNGKTCVIHEQRGNELERWGNPKYDSKLHM